MAVAISSGLRKNILSRDQGERMSAVRLVAELHAAQMVKTAQISGVDLSLQDIEANRESVVSGFFKGFHISN